MLQVRWAMVAMLVVGAMLWWGVSATTSLTGAQRTIYVAPYGSDGAGFGSRAKPYRTITQALAVVKPGTRVVVRAGTYAEYLITQHSGTAEQPIRLTAEGVVKLVGGNGSGRLLELRHDYYIIEGFDFSTADVLLWLEGARHNVVTNNFFHHAQGECVRAKYHSQHNLFRYNRVEDCGREDFAGGGGGKNGEGVYLGTAPEQLDRNPSPERDATNFNTVQHNTFVTNGNECVDIKEGAEHNVVEFNNCTGQRDPESAGFGARGNHNIFRYNRSVNNLGAGIRFGGDETGDGTGNEAYGNILTGNQGYALKIMRRPQGRICGNEASSNTRGFTNEDTITPSACPFPLSTPGAQLPR